MIAQKNVDWVWLHEDGTFRGRSRFPLQQGLADRPRSLSTAMDTTAPGLEAMMRADIAVTPGDPVPY
ncbi:hypothetical protein [Tomitella biformata]|uniref:hypothetical protein n=1 Tax=Tomitella biformata TaxID=630403 RepID=UPI00046518E8|nr:hypothetical protein [Tomitella biformata]